MEAAEKPWGVRVCVFGGTKGGKVGETGWSPNWAFLGGWWTEGRGSSTRVNGVGEGRRGSDEV